MVSEPNPLSAALRLTKLLSRDDLRDVTESVTEIMDWSRLAAEQGMLVPSAAFIIHDPAKTFLESKSDASQHASTYSLFLTAPVDFEHPLCVAAVQTAASELCSVAVVHVSLAFVERHGQLGQEITIAVEDLARGLYVLEASVKRSDLGITTSAFHRRNVRDFEKRLAPW